MWRVSRCWTGRNQVANEPIFGIVFFALLVTSCGGDSPVAPPTAPTQSPLPVTPDPIRRRSQSPNSLNGDVYDTASRRVAGATVEILDGPQAGVVTTTNDAGHFSFTGTFDDATRFRASKPGHVTKTQTSRMSCETCARYSGFQLELEVAPIDLTGRYTLSFIADSVMCRGIPETARARTYNATIARHRTAPWVFDVSIPDTSVLHGYEWEGMNMSVAGNYVSMFVGMPFDGVVDYCKLPAGSPSPTSSGTYSCPATQPSAIVRCSSTQHTFLLSRR